MSGCRSRCRMFSTPEPLSPFPDGILPLYLEVTTILTSISIIEFVCVTVFHRNEMAFCVWLLSFIIMPDCLLRFKWNLLWTLSSALISVGRSQQFSPFFLPFPFRKPCELPYPIKVVLGRIALKAFLCFKWAVFLLRHLPEQISLITP